MSRLTDQQDTNIVCEYYGINRLTLRVECISETKGGILSLMRGGEFITHPLGGKEGLAECGAAVEAKAPMNAMLRMSNMSDSSA